METVKVGLVGFGTIGTGVAKLLINDVDRITEAVGRRVELVRVCDLDTTRDRDVVLPEGVLTDDLSQITDDPEITTVVQLIGGAEPARTIMLQLLESGKDVITANKALLAYHGPELFNRARELGRTIAFEAAVAGGIPIISTLSGPLQANRCQSMQAILNGTSNFILSQMEEKGVSYDSAVAEAQRLGYAEADPTMDVDGSDAAQKLAILAHLAFGVAIDWKDIPKVGIDAVHVDDLRYANELGYSIKLLAIADLTDEGLELYVLPTFVSQRSPMSKVRNAFNAVRITGNAVGRTFLHGLGAGEMPTASAVVGDLIDTLLGRTAITFNALKLWSPERKGPALRDPNRIMSKYYFRFMVDNRPGVLAEIAGVFAKHGISIASLIQHEADADHEPVPLVIMTHAAPEGSVKASAHQLDQMECVRTKLVRMRVHD
jgi:homoserine dehydrogenase